MMLQPKEHREATLLLLGRMALRRRSSREHKTANTVEDLIEGFGQVYSEIQEEIDQYETN